ncbi:replication-associated recombination protein A [Laribacter hongkongensis]|uniref:replication-associated recombination protein A n=1 Tax=Laribacter hongkongensis TaxID=168471 RepID=UPI001EFEE3FF|nr:replication-associated recombination protein A [Laribacter hongkongensis]MCG9076150.1 replication-associated recombination protein A [Laribacter hongkongensis]MCG9094686.1 replication-associated recombination protein A [Laribacter hongkongensis]MCG9106226.1 replication-associated recombination protein A [Laribacter hongkongensis]
MADLFGDTGNRTVPLAETLRPTTLDDVVGQQHLIGAGKPLRLAIESHTPHSMILWGPPGVGKTTLARILAHAFDAEFTPLSAVFSGVKDIREAVERAQMAAARGRHTILFVDEVHRFNKSQQDAFLPFVEAGLFTFIGATTENPSFEVNAALLSRAQVYVLKPLTDADLEALFVRAHAAGVLEGLELDAAARAVLAGYADGDARRFLNLLEQTRTAARAQQVQHVDTAFLENVLTLNARRFDKGGDAFYDQISALHKSVRGSHPDAALYWLTRMLDGGADPHYLARRLVRMAWEDIGLADPRAAEVALNAARTYDMLGSPEGELALAQAVIYLAVAAKSNAGYNAYNQARAFVKQGKSREVPVHLRNAPTRLMKELGYGHAYRYAHDEPHAYAAGETYLPEGMDEPGWYQPVPRGLEQKISDKLAFLRQLDAGARPAGQKKP